MHECTPQAARQNHPLPAFLFPHIHFSKSWRSPQAALIHTPIGKSNTQAGRPACTALLVNESFSGKATVKNQSTATPRRRLFYMPGNLWGQVLFCIFLHFFAFRPSHAATTSMMAGKHTRNTQGAGHVCGHSSQSPC